MPINEKRNTQTEQFESQDDAVISKPGDNDADGAKEETVIVDEQPVVESISLLPEMKKPRLDFMTEVNPETQEAVAQPVQINVEAKEQAPAAPAPQAEPPAQEITIPAEQPAAAPKEKIVKQIFFMHSKFVCMGYDHKQVSALNGIYSEELHKRVTEAADEATVWTGIAPYTPGVEVPVTPAPKQQDQQQGNDEGAPVKPSVENELKDFSNGVLSVIERHWRKPIQVREINELLGRSNDFSYELTRNAANSNQVELMLHKDGKTCRCPITPGAWINVAG